MARPRLPSLVTALLLSPAAGCLVGGDAGGAGQERGELDLTARQRLGKYLFEDTSLSEPAGQACASCHDPAQGFAGNAGSPIDAVARGAAPGALGGRNVPTAMYASFSPAFHFESEAGEAEPVHEPVGGQFWDGRADGLAAQAKGPFLNPREMNNPDAASVVAKVRAGGYATLFRAVYGKGAFDDPAAAYDRIAEAIADYEGTAAFHPFASRFDDHLRGQGALDAREARGLALFSDPEKGNCIACHAGTPGSADPRDWLFTDFTYDNLGLPRNARLPDNADPARYDLGLCQQPGLAARAPAGFDLAGTCGAFKVPTLRNVALTAPYGHNGVFPDLRSVVSFYATRGTNPERWYPAGPDGAPRIYDDLPDAYHGNVNAGEAPYDRLPGEAPRLTEDEIDDVVAFLGALTDR